MYKSHQFSILNNAIDVKKFSYNKAVREEVRDELSVTNCFVIGHVGRFSIQKNQKQLVRIFKSVYDKYPETRLILLGAGVLERDIKEMVQNLGLKGAVQFLGVKDRVDRYMQAMDVFVFPSLSEGLPLTLIEAQSAGLPCIVSNAISDEVVITKDVHVMDAQDSDEGMGKQNLGYNEKSRRNDNTELMNKSGYDIVSNVKLLRSLYLGE